MTKNMQSFRNKTLILLAAAGVCFAVLAGANSLHAATATWNSGWTGGSGPAGVPATGDAIDIVSGDLTWNSGSWTNTVASWNQGSGYTGKVTFNTTYSSGVTITGNADLLGGTWAHLDNSTTQTNRVALTVGGNLNVGSLGAINVDYLGLAD